ncbi:MAG: GNAT family N-acetyltransferase [Rubrivivax sp.]|nr:GNAT family N-acetyltransferase [Rubrivivax sp.]
MPSDFLIRRERPDQPEVMALLRSLDDYLGALYPPEANHIMDVASLGAPEVRFLVAREADAQAGPGDAGAGRAVGTAAVRLMPGEEATGGERYGEVKRMYVAPAQRGRRLGAALVAELEATLLDEGVGLALLETGRDQTEAVRLYERCGYRERGPFGGYPDNGLSVFYGRRLSP